MDTLKELYDQWSLQKKEEEYFSKADYEIFKKKGIKRFEKGNIKHMGFNFEYLPQPWWGELKNPKI